MHEPDHLDEQRLPLVLAVVFLIVLVLSVLDLVLDRPTTVLSAHIALELGLVAVSLGAALYLAGGWYRARLRLQEAEDAFESRERERREWVERARPALEGLAAHLDSQFDAWALTAAERRTALMLLKGLSHKRIARATGITDRTVRQHAVAVYRKSGLSGRAQLAGFFLEALALPETAEREPS